MNHSESGKNRSNRLLSYFLSLLLALPLGTVQAQQTAAGEPTAAGMIVMVSGSVSVETATGEIRPLSRRDDVFVGDTIVTGPESRTQIRMVDQALVALKESTRFTIVNYQYNEAVIEDNVSTLDLIEGGFRTASGRIGQLNREGYNANAGNFATIGIRGTDYEVIILPSGRLFTGVYEGGTRITNNFGVLDLGVGADFDFAEVPDSQSPPRRAY